MKAVQQKSSDNTEVLAINGGIPVRTCPWPKRRTLGPEERDAVCALMDRVVDAGGAIPYNGPEEEAFCNEFAAFQGGGFADAVSSGSTAIFVALRALGLEAGSEVIISPISDAGGVMPVPLAGLVPVPGDCARGSFNIGAEQIRERITPRTRAVIVTHIAGIPADMDPIMAVAREHNLRVIEDCAQAPGALYKGAKVGTIGDIGCFSTMYGKHLTTGGQGGVTFTRDKQLWQQLRRHADRGKPFGFPGAVTDIAAINCNSDDLRCAIGRVQLRRFPEMLRRRREMAKLIHEECSDLRCARPVACSPENGTESAHWFLVFEFRADRCQVGKDRFVEALVAEGIPFLPQYNFPTYCSEWFMRHSVFAGSNFPWSDDSPREYPMPNADASIRTFFKLHEFYEALTDDDIGDLIRALRKVDRHYAS